MGSHGAYAYQVMQRVLRNFQEAACERQQKVRVFRNAAPL